MQFSNENGFAADCNIQTRTSDSVPAAEEEDATDFDVLAPLLVVPAVLEKSVEVLKGEVDPCFSASEVRGENTWCGCG